MATLAGILSGIVVGLALALVLNLELLADVFAQRRLDVARRLTTAGAPSAREQILQWMRRSLLIALPVVFGLIGLASAEELFGGAL